MIPNRTPPISSAEAVETEKVRERKRLSGSSGSGARRSMTMKAASATTPITPAPITCGESQAKLVPPHALASSTAVTPTTSASAPA